MNFQHYLLEDAGVAVTCIMFESALDHSVLIKLQLSVVCVCYSTCMHRCMTGQLVTCTVHLLPYTTLLLTSKRVDHCVLLTHSLVIPILAVIITRPVDI